MLTKLKTFLNPIEGREKYLNEMADQGYRLIKSGSMLQKFEKTNNHIHHYIVQYIGHMSNRERMNYCDFLHDLGYKIFFAPLNIGKVSLGNVRLRPYNQGRAALATNPGMINKEIIIIETDGSKNIPAFSEKEGQKNDLKRRLRPAVYLMIVSLVMLLVGLLVHLDMPRDWWHWTYWSYRPVEKVLWPWLGIGGLLLIYSAWRIMKLRFLIKNLE
ncbi:MULTISPECIES: DUF2812 domain-containing protein [Aerococcus]|uniref:DUF2812 domain-containing protein n=1 Tax=Aerococcus TaxID=1375 RepID=UPI0018A7B1CA|nr:MULTISPECIES: DUF2812 domain-containing protein [Aerococcus]MCY3035616.1 DUF2812 domain-containing protein [Aerococcus sp. Group 2]MCY3039290.1 DUF2812 domain-containing protein [Aerococcus sp. Group 2]MCY3041192.1 DUF2812 domain-containing protein [Aerococcus sp. Group 2]MCY3042429.1 DUF2812 domain-containing protein [Aerococcus sp. Group 2]MDK6520951.1 DUF2812 domain-containing protein [Aerococcus urinae]